MPPPGWDRVKKMFSDALGLAPQDRDVFLDRACGHDPGLRQEVAALLEADERHPSFLRDATVRPLAAVPTEFEAVAHELATEGSRPGDRIAAYRLIRRVAEGGMGEVWLAERADGQFEQRVAIKLLRPGLHQSAMLERFRHERQVLAQLAHPFIARLLDGGATDTGQPFLAMEYIAGIAIDQYCQEHDLDLRSRLRLFEQVCAAVQFAHGNLVVHRDLKPSNILVSADGTPKLLDFGIAKVVSPIAEIDPHLTVTGQRILTPRYASPEQVAGRPITTASDVYSLGVVLFELLTDRSPYELQD
ncbi:MAG TPA: serine/threonine-protein kinase, partial [Pirellulaceae bacterium]